MATDKKKIFRFTKAARKSPYTPVVKEFPELHPVYDLGLDFLENKQKVGKSLPLIPTDRGKKSTNITQETKSRRELQRQFLAEHFPEDTVAVKDENVVQKAIGESDGTRRVSDKKSKVGMNIKKTETFVPTERPKKRPLPIVEEEEEIPVIKQEKEEEIVEEDTVASMLRKFRILKMGNPKFSIPDFTELSDLELMKRTYDNIVPMIKLESSLVTMKRGIATAFAVIEFALAYVGIDAQGLATCITSLVQENKFDSMLIELGERQRFNMFASLPVEARLFLTLGFYSLVFIIGKKFAAARCILNLFGVSVSVPEERTPPATVLKAPSKTPQEIRDSINSFAKNA